MSNTILTHQMIAREAAAMLVEENQVIRNINTNRKIEFGEEVNGYKKGDTVKIGIPPVPVVFDGASFAGGGSAPDATETFVNLQLSKQKHVALTFTAKEKKLNISEFKDRFLRPAMNSLGSYVNADLLNDFMIATPNVVGTWGTTPATRAPFRQAGSVLDKFLAPIDDRSLHISPDSTDGLAEANATLFHTAKELQGEFSDHAIGMFAGFEFYKQISNPLFATGAGTGYLINGATQSGAALTVDTGTGIITKGSIITIAGVNAVHPITGVDLGMLRQFVVTAQVAGGGTSIPIYPALTPTTATLIGTVVASPADNAAITIFGTASQSKRQNLGFHKNAFAAAFAPLPVLASCEGYTATVQGVSVRVMTFGDGKADVESTRVDVLYGDVAVRPDHSCRITE